MKMPTLRTAPMAPIRIEASSSPRTSMSGRVEASRAAPSPASPLSCQQRTIAHPIRNPQPTPPRLPRRATVRQRDRLTTQTIVRTEITSTAANARGIGGQPADIRGITPQSRQTMESPRPSRVSSM